MFLGMMTAESRIAIVRSESIRVRSGSDPEQPYKPEQTLNRPWTTLNRPWTNPEQPVNKPEQTLDSPEQTLDDSAQCLDNQVTESRQPGLPWQIGDLCTS